MAKTRKTKATGRGERWWKNLTDDEKRKHTDWRFDAGHRNNKVMDDLGLSVGTVAGIKRRWRERIEASEQAAKMEQRAASKKPAVPKQPARAPDTPEPPITQEQPKMTDTRFVATEKPRRPKMAASEKTQCDHNVDGRCGLEYTVRKRDGNYCDKHAPLHQ